MNVAKHPCEECQHGSNSPFSEEIKKKLRQELERGIVYSCHWVEKEHGSVTAMGCFALSGNGAPAGPLCATGAALLDSLAVGKPELKDTATKHNNNSVQEVQQVSDVITPSGLKLKPKKSFAISQPDWVSVGTEQMHLAGWVDKVAFADGTSWIDDGTHACKATSKR